jgi:hypothetical protein
MKRLSILLITLVLLNSANISCKKENEAGEWMRISGLKSGGESLRWFTENVQVQFVLNGAIVTGTNADGSTLQIAVDRAVEGVFDVETSQAVVSYNSSGSLDPTKIFLGKSGTVTVSTNDLEKRLFQGAFTLTLENEVTSTEQKILGSFRVFY